MIAVVVNLRENRYLTRIKIYTFQFFNSFFLLNRMNKVLSLGLGTFPLIIKLLCIAGLPPCVYMTRSRSCSILLKLKIKNTQIKEKPFYLLRFIQCLLVEYRSIWFQLC